MLKKIKIRKDVFNSAYLVYLHSEVRTQIYFGGSSSGKSVFLAQRCVFDLIAGERNYLICRNVASSMRGSVFKEVVKAISAWNVSNLFTINKTEMTITCKNKKQAIFKGLDDVEKIKSITADDGVITDIWIEEATECTLDDIKQLRKRLRGKSKVKKRITFSFNPILKSHWIFKEYFTGFTDDAKELYDEDKDLLILKTTYIDNKFLEEDDIKELTDETDSYFYNVYTCGNWGVLGELIFRNWKTADLSRQIRYFDNIRNGLDFGFTNHPTAYNRLHIDKAQKKIYIFEEFHEKGLKNPQIAEQLKPIIEDEYVTCDSAEPKSIQELQDNGINAEGAVKGKDSILFGIQWLQGYEIIIDIKCQETINEFQLYQWKKNKDGEVLNVAVDKNNHHIDGIRYACEDDMEERIISGAQVIG